MGGSTWVVIGHTGWRNITKIYISFFLLMKFLRTMHEMQSFLTFTTLNFHIFLAHDTSPWWNRLWIMSHSIHSHRVWYPSAWSIQRIGHYGRDEEKELKTHHGQQEKKLQARDSERSAPRGTARCEGMYLSGHPQSSAGSTSTPCGALGGHSEESWPWLSSCLHPRCPFLASFALAFCTILKTTPKTQDNIYK